MIGNALLEKENQALKLQLENNSIEMENQKNQLEQYRQAYESLQQQVKDLLRHRFGKRSEKQIDPKDPQMALLAGDVSALQNKAAEEKTTEVAAHKRRSKPKKDTSKYPREIRIIPVADLEKICSCGCQKEVIRYEIKETFHHKPAEYCIVEQRREVVACRKGCNGSIQTAPVPKHVLPKVKATEEMLASVVINKLHHRQPHYHLEKYATGVGLSRETMSRWMIQLVAPLQPLYNLMKDELIAYDVGGLDATMLQVLKEPGRKAEKKSYLYCCRGGSPEKSVILYTYNAHEHQKVVDEWFDEFKGYLHMDADNFWDDLLKDPNVHSVYCHAHVRRKFEAVAKHAKKQGLAHEAVRFYKKLYKIERRAKAEKLSAEARYQLRQDESALLLKKFKTWLDTNYPTILKKSPLGKAFAYALNRWPGLETFLKDGRLEIDNNLTEQEIKPIVIARKNFMFANSVDGAHALSLHFSFIRTALKHGLDPYRYYVSILKRVAECETVADFEKLLPWNITQTNSDLRLETI